jgi:hypothetical protein
LLDGDVHLIEKPFTAEALLQRAGQILDRDRTTRAGESPRAPAAGPAADGPGPNRDRAGPDAAQTRTATSG